MPILEHNMRCFLKGDLKGMMNVRAGAARVSAGLHQSMDRIDASMAESRHWQRT